MNITTIHGRLIDAAALAGVLSHALMFDRHVDERDAGKPDLAAVAQLLHRELQRLRDAAEAAQDAADKAQA